MVYENELGRETSPQHGPTIVAIGALRIPITRVLLVMAVDSACTDGSVAFPGDVTDGRL